MADNARGVHVSPGVYSREIDLTYAVKSLGITTLGVAGETLKGPAFEPMHIENWREFTAMFGGTSTEKFKGSQYPKYELPYIAKSYLTESKQLEVVRVLGLSGYNAGPAWVVTAKFASSRSIDQADRMAVAVLRPRGDYYKYRRFDPSTGTCACPTDSYDSLVYRVGEITKDKTQCETPVEYNGKAVVLDYYNPLYASGNECEGYMFGGEGDSSSDEYYPVSTSNIGRFKVKGFTGIHPMDTELSDMSGTTDYFEYPVSLNSYDKDYILNVLGTNPQDGDAPLYVESLYDVALTQCIGETNENEVIGINKKLDFYQVYYPADYSGLKSVSGLIELQEENLTRRNVSIRYLADLESSEGNDAIHAHPYNYFTNKPITIKEVVDGEIQVLSGVSASTKAISGDTVDTQTNKYNSLSGDAQTQYGETPVMIDVEPGRIYTVRQYTDNTGKRHYYYSYYLETTIDAYADNRVSYKDNSGNTYNSQEEAFAKISDDCTSAETFYEKDSLLKANGFESNAIDVIPLYDKLIYGGTKGNEKRNGAQRMVIVKNETDGLWYRLVKVYGDTESVYGNVSSASTIDGGGNAELQSGSTQAMTSGTSTDSGSSSAVSSASTIDGGGSGELQSGSTQAMDSSGSSYVYDVHYVECDLNDYKSAYRYSSTPWIVSNLMGDYDHIELKRLFRFHTISDGNSSNKEVKISIENIRTDSGLFDVVVRDINDTDEYQIPLEKFSQCSLIPGSSKYISYKIGSFDGMYERKSKYITVEVNENSTTERAIPAGFMGYPCAKYDGITVIDERLSGLTNPILKYNLYYDQDIKNRKQYFGLSTKVGVDLDIFTFKGNEAYIEHPSFVTQGFHLDSRLNMDGYPSEEDRPDVTVDGEYGYVFDAVSPNNRTTLLTETPIIGNEEAMQGSIYEYVNLRKFTVYFYGGFDGWDEYRSKRTNTDDFKVSQYLGTYDNNSGQGYSFNRIDNTEMLGLNQAGITSDWYAYLSAIRQFANPEAVDINVFATPGIDYVNNKMLVEETIEMLEEERADSIYVVTTPDKPEGASDFVDEMYTPSDAVYNLEDTEIDSNYTCTYYPWIKYYDQDNSQYIYLPPTKDVVRNFAQTDNTTYPWFAPAGLERGDVNCVRAHIITKLAEEDELYDGRINPVKTFATDGVKIWGQKNLQIRESQLNRIAVRRLLLRMRKLIAIACRNMIFEPNDSITKNTFLSTVQPIMDNIMANRGISDYKIEVEDTVESRERRELPAKIFFKPYNALEYITLDFILTPEGVSFDDI